jgi:hypothetical protein
MYALYVCLICTSIDERGSEHNSRIWKAPLEGLLLIKETKKGGKKREMTTAPFEKRMYDIHI